MDVELRVWSNRAASRFAIEHAVLDNPHWDVTEEAGRVNVSTLILGGDPAVDSMFTGEHAAAVLKSNPLMTHVVIQGAGHSVHRDKPEDTLSQIVRFLV
jgi:pimeloyl-ACP methyl ester carboxylesterase